MRACVLIIEAPLLVPSVSEEVALHEGTGGRLVCESTHGRETTAPARKIYLCHLSVNVDVLHNHGAKAILRQFSAMIST